MPPSTWFTASRMRNIAIAIVTIDIILLGMWIGGAGYIAHSLATIDCFHDQATPHFLILIHFVLALHLAALVGEINKERYMHKTQTGRELIRLPYYAYAPFAWILASLVSLSGDVILLAWAVIEYTHSTTDECDSLRILHISLDLIALIVSLISILWFIVFSFYTVREDRVSHV